MNFSAVRGFNAYSQFSAKIREAVKNRVDETSQSENSEDNSYSIFSEPIDTVTISESALKAFAAMKAGHEKMPELSVTREDSPHLKFREWARSSGLVRGAFTQKVPGNIMNSALAGSGISVSDDEEYSVTVDVLSAATVSGKNAEKARAIQNLLNSTPSGINWGLLLLRLPPS